MCWSSAPAGRRGAGRLCHVGGRDPSTSRLCGPPLAPPPSHGERAQGNLGKQGWAPAASRPFSEGMHMPTLGSGDRQRLEAFLGDLDTREESFLVGPDWGTGLRMAPFLPTRALGGRCAQVHYPYRNGLKGEGGLAQGHSDSGGAEAPLSLLLRPLAAVSAGETQCPCGGGSLATGSAPPLSVNTGFLVQMLAKRFRCSKKLETSEVRRAAF